MVTYLNLPNMLPQTLIERSSTMRLLLEFEFSSGFRGGAEGGTLFENAERVHYRG